MLALFGTGEFKAYAQEASEAAPEPGIDLSDADQKIENPTEEGARPEVDLDQSTAGETVKGDGPVPSRGVGLFDRLQFYATTGVGVPFGDYEPPSYSIQVGSLYTLVPRVRFGSYFQYNQAESIQNVSFPSTGYTETRNYDLSVLSLGGIASYSLRRNISAVVGVGVSFTRSQLSSVSTTAPLPSSLQKGYERTSYGDLACLLALDYGYRADQYGIGVRGGYSSTTMDSATSINELFVALVYKYYLSSTP